MKKKGIERIRTHPGVNPHNARVLTIDVERVRTGNGSRPSGCPAPLSLLQCSSSAFPSVFEPLPTLLVGSGNDALRDSSRLRLPVRARNEKRNRHSSKPLCFAPSLVLCPKTETGLAALKIDARMDMDKISPLLANSRQQQYSFRGSQNFF